MNLNWNELINEIHTFNLFHLNFLKNDLIPIVYI